MSSTTTIGIEKFARLVGTPKCPAVVDVRSDEDFAADPRLIPGSVRRPHDSAASWVAEFAGTAAIVVCRRGQKLSEGVAAWLRQAGLPAEALAGGFEAWCRAELPLVPAAKIPARDGRGRTVWVTRARPKIDRIACPWLIRRFLDPRAVILFVSPSEVLGVAERLGATPFDVEGVFWSHRDELCSFDTMLAEFGLEIPALDRLARIVRGADTARLDLEPEAAGLLAISLGLSRIHADDHEQLDAGMLVYDALFRWARDASDETHNWPTNKPRA